MRRCYIIFSIITGPPEVIVVPTTQASTLSRIPTSLAVVTRPSLFDTWQPTTRTHLLHTSVAVFLVLVDVFLSSTPLAPARLGLTTLNACCLPLASRLPVAGATASLGVTTAALTVPGDVSTLGIAMCWGPIALLASRGHHPGTIWALTTINLLASTSLGTLAPVRELTISAVVGAPCLTLGLVLRHQRHRDDAAARLRQQQRDHQQRLLVSELHDTVVRNLTHAVMQAEQVRLARPHDPDLAHTLDTVTSPVRIAVGQLRYLLKAMSATTSDDTTLLLSSTPPRPLGETLAHARTVLSQRGTSLTADGLEALDNDTIGPGAHQQITRVLNELIDNAVKYASPHGHVTLLLETDGSTLECMCTNSHTPTPAHQQAAHKGSRRPRRPDHTTSSGLGLEAARHRTESLGGTLATSQTPTHWATTLTIPLRPTL